MNAIKDFNPPVTDQSQSADDGAVVAVRINIPETPLIAPLWPTGNRAATEILCRLLRSRIEAAGIAVKSATFGFPFNSSWYCIDLAQRPAGPALAVLRAELEALGLLDWAQIAWDDPDEGIWRRYHPRSGVFKSPSSEEMQADSRLLLEASEAIKREIGYGSA